MTDTARLDALAAQLIAAYDGPLLPPIRDAFAPGDIASAYQVQLAQVRRWTEAGRRVAGRKIGLTSKVVQAQLGVDEPDFGHLFADMVFGDNETLPIDRLQQPKVEAEVALILSRDLDDPDTSVADLLDAVAWVVPAIEIVSSRIADWQINILDTVADNASSGLVALGGPARRLSGLDLVNCGMTMTVNGVEASNGVGAACLGSPLNAATWLARRSAALGRPLRRGELILTGALGPMVAVGPGDAVSATIEGLGSVSLKIGQ